MQVVVGLGHQVGRAQLLEQHAHQNAVARVLADADDGRVEVLHAKRRQQRLVRGVQLHGLRHIGGDVIDQLLVGVHGQHLLAQVAQGLGEARAEAAQAQHQKLLAFHGGTILSRQPIMIFSSG